MRKVATIILNRNLPTVTDKLVSHIKKYDGHITDVFVVEAGSDKDKLSKNTTWHADWSEAVQIGLRYSRGMNYGLSNLYKEGKFSNYEAFFLITNDTRLDRVNSIEIMLKIFENIPRMAILSPCSKKWGEKNLLIESTIKCFWYIHNNAFLIRKEFISQICNKKFPDFYNFLFDGSNFRGYHAESELIAKAYVNDWCAGITTDVWAEEDESYLLKKYDLIKTETQDRNLELYVQEGLDWMKSKYGFTSRWQMQQYVKLFYDKFFEMHPEYKKLKI